MVGSFILFVLGARQSVRSRYLGSKRMPVQQQIPMPQQKTPAQPASAQLPK